ncbi:hypothetical protein [Acinetobacter sp. MD2(2019)]|uniref:hypothetical protein n=1 Tax=Acinetobacter sp. MD2(2019) TaxID=2605273 RepID=UPI002D1EB995|nr:hypothetical protein [Acinetobacter sp. MD2(2019)]MEB3753196.1 hypothetical protein [Acinetobacter sp. MD2(2019)]
MQQLQLFLQEKISLDELDLDQLIECAKQQNNPDSPEYRLLELTLNQILPQYLERAKKYIYQ